jgi:peptide/nickel transport system permease protein
MGLIRAIAQRALLAVFTVVMVSAVVFVAAELIPQDAALAALGIESTEVQRAAFRERMHLDDPPVQRYLQWANALIHGDPGVSVITGRPIGPELSQRLRVTAMLAGISLLGGVALAFPLAIVAAVRKQGPLDLVVSTIALINTAVPEFIIALGVLFLFAVELKWVPVISVGISSGSAAALILPSVTLALAVGAWIYRFARASIEETLNAPYVRTAILNGFSPARILWRHVVPNASIVIVNVVALNAIALLGGVIVVEAVFSYPGLGRLFLNAISTKDITQMQSISALLAALFVAINFIADGVVVFLDPRLRTR